MATSHFISGHCTDNTVSNYHLLHLVYTIIMNKYTCDWTDCSHVAGNAYNLYRHMLVKHWPWQLNRYVCTTCEKGWHDQPAFDTHRKSDKHLLLQQAMGTTKQPLPCAKEFAANWLQCSLEAGLISKAHNDRCTCFI